MDDCRPGYFSAKGIDDDLESVPITCSCFTTTSLMVVFGLRRMKNEVKVKSSSEAVV